LPAGNALCGRPAAVIEDYNRVALRDRALGEVRVVIDWNQFTPVSALVGGILIGLASALFILVNGRIAGISGIVGGLVRPKRAGVGWRIAFVAGLLVAPVAYAAVSVMPALTIEAGYPQLIVAGLLVGIGTRYAGGCTSGHGVCGISRWSMRSIAATIVFMAAGFATVYVARHVIG
jgi:uncharacterized membrane protein YedE/YeeE